MDDEATTVALVASEDDAAELVALLAPTDIEVRIVGDGGDDILACLEREPPAALVMSARLERSDARVLALALRASDACKHTGLVLIGDQTGPVRNAIDALEFDVDRFVRRPLAVNALRFAIISAARDRTLSRFRTAPDSTLDGEAEMSPAMGGHVEEADGAMRVHAVTTGDGMTPAIAQRPAMIGGIPDADSDAAGAALGGSEKTLGVTVGGTKQVPERYPSEWGDTVWHQKEPQNASVLVADAPVVDSGDAPVFAVGGEATAGSYEQALAVAPTAMAPVEPLADEQAADADGSALVPPQREPTLILTGGGVGVPEVVVTPSSSQRSGRSAAYGSAAPHAAPHGSGHDDGLVHRRKLSEPGLVVSAEAAVVSTSSRAVAAQQSTGSERASSLQGSENTPGLYSKVEAAQSAVPPSFESRDTRAASTFGRELREKMSAMAERLFPGHPSNARRAIDIGVPHDAYTEIDLTAIGMDTVPGGYPDEPAPYAGDGAAAALVADVDGDIQDAPAHPGSHLRGEIEIAPDVSFAIASERRGYRSSEVGGARGELSLRDEDIASLLARLYRAGFTGRATVRRADAEKTIHFADGQPVFASSNLPHDRMGSLLYREGKITRAQHVRSREIVAESGRRMGEILVDMGFLKRRELLPAVRRHIEDIVYSLFAWDSGEYVTVPAEPAVGEKIRLSRHPATLILEGIRRKYGLDMLEVRLGGEDAVVVVRAGEPIAAMLRELELGPAVRQVLDCMDGTRALAQVAEQAQVELLVVYQLAFGLVVLGMADIERGEAAGLPAWGHAGQVAPLVGETDLAIDRQRLLAKHAHVAEADYFTLLGVREDASRFEIQRAYESARRDFAVIALPPVVRRELAQEIDDINELLDEAYAVLRDDVVRDSYRTHLRDWD